MSPRPLAITGEIELRDGTKTSFSLSTEYRWEQWGQPESKRYETVDLLHAIERDCVEDHLLDEELE
jgi:hypothetical protein